MTERTYKIIMACKRATGYNITDAVKAYMSKECMCPEHHYDEWTINGIMFTAMCDYLDSCDKPSVFMQELKNVYHGSDLSTGERIAIAFLNVRVKKRDGQYVNGFGEWAEKEVT